VNRQGSGIWGVLYLLYAVALIAGLAFGASKAFSAIYPLNRNDRGGLVVEYIQRVTDHNEAGDRVELRMLRCLSACTLLLAVDDVCVTKRGRFGFHGTDIRGKMNASTAQWDRVLAGMYPATLGDWFSANAAGKRRVSWLTGADLIRDYGIGEC